MIQDTSKVLVFNIFWSVIIQCFFQLKASQDREAATETPSWLQDYWKTGSYGGNQSNTVIAESNLRFS